MITNYEMFYKNNKHIAFTYECDILSKIRELEDTLDCDRCPARVVCENNKHVYGCFGNFAMWASQDFIDSMRSDD